MGYYGCNRAEIRRDTINGVRVIIVRVFIEDLGPSGRWEEKRFETWESLADALAWMRAELQQLSM